MVSKIELNPDNLSRKNPSVAEWLHWLVVNIPASNVIEGINGGELSNFFPASKGIQPAPFKLTIQANIKCPMDHRLLNRELISIDILFLCGNTKEGDPIAGNFFLAQHE
ncbi:hypothetical protein OESDEN_08534 [Oesophagostomum dentatum]|uniref:Phosphatidylethanolamine-binding protein n=1 Tax=Oesophagostomum dentatum TaxID=61180 RepID=A0A0B1T2Z3_OESDE|nr:hypothetical protein OESDEN_08534 [Oesophagostomum dentatum]